MGKFGSMAKSKYFQLIFVCLVIFFQQSAVAQNPPKPVTANPANSTSSDFEVADEDHPRSGKYTPQEKRAIGFLNRADYRQLDRIKWPDDPSLEGPSKAKYQDLDKIKTASEKKKVSLQNCQKQVAQYEKEIQASYGIKKGAVPGFEVVCELLGVSLKKVKAIDHPVFNVMSSFVTQKLDQLFLRYIESQEFERSKVYYKSILGMLGLPIKYAVSVLQVFVLLSLVLNGFLIFKILS